MQFCPPIAKLAGEHNGVLAMLAAMEKAAGEMARDPARAAQELREALSSFDGELKVHFRQEEEALFPILERYIPRQGGPTGVMLLEHQDLWQKVDLLRKALGDIPRAEGAKKEAVGAARYIVNLLRNHIMKENNILFPLAEDTLGPQDKGELETKARAIAG